MKTLRITLFGLLLFVVTACTLQSTATSVAQVTPSTSIAIASVIPTTTPLLTASLTETPTATPKPTKTFTPEPSPRPTETPKPVLISYFDGAGDGADEDYICLRWRYEYSFVLYEDGQFVVYTENGLMEKTLTQQEITDLLSRIENTGYLQVEGTGELRENDPIYEIHQPIQVGEGTPATWVTVKGKTIVTDGWLGQYLVDPIQQTLEIIRSYRPPSMTPYVPERLGLWVWDVTGYELEFPYVTPIPPTEEWPLELPLLAELEKHTDYNKTLRYAAKNYAVLNIERNDPILQIFNRFPSSRIVTQNSKAYYVVACPVIP